MFIRLLIKIVFIPLIHAWNIPDFLTKSSSRLWYQNETHLVNSDNPYCSICCIDVNQVYKGRKCGIHTMCAYASRPIGAACTGLIVMRFSENEIDAIVDAHNTVRNRIAMGLEEDGNPGPQPPAANMKLMSWDSELAKVASLWATQCVFSHDRCRDLERFPVGQNIAKGTYASKSDLEHIADWYELVQFASDDALKSYDPKGFEELAPYTQLIWADTYLVGCARISFQKLVDGQVIYREHFFCNYGPSGNIPQQSVYKIGEACTACSEGTFCTNPEYPGLCGNEIFNETKLRIHKKKQPKQVENNRSNKHSLICFYIFSIVLLSISI